jgi:integrase
MARIVKVKVGEHGRPYEVRWSWYDAHGQRHFKKERFRTQRDAKARKREVEQQISDASIPDDAAGRLTVSHWAERWYASKSARTKPSTAKGYRVILDASVLPVFGEARIRAITTADVQEWVDGLTQAPPTIKHHFQTLRAVLAHAVKGKAISTNPAVGVEWTCPGFTDRCLIVLRRRVGGHSRGWSAVAWCCSPRCMRTAVGGPRRG